MKREIYFYENKQVSSSDAAVLKKQNKWQLLNSEIYHLIQTLPDTGENITICYDEKGNHEILPKNSIFESTLSQKIKAIENYRKKPVSDFIPMK